MAHELGSWVAHLEGVKMAKTKTGTEGDMAHELGSGLSLKQAATELDCSIATVKRYKKLLLTAFAQDKGRVLTSSGSLTQEGLEQLQKIASFSGSEEYLDWAQENVMSLAHEPSSHSCHLPSVTDFQPDVVVEDGVTFVSLAHEVDPGEIDISRYRPGATRLARISDIGTVVQNVSLVTDAAIEAMDDDLEAQRRQLDQNRAMVEQLRGKRQTLRERAIVFEAKTAAMEVINSSVIAEAEQVLAEVRG